MCSLLTENPEVARERGNAQTMRPRRENLEEETERMNCQRMGPRGQILHENLEENRVIEWTGDAAWM
jgi:hypothetical protein